ncbi:MAG: winged helix-turn-helix transcriptional regulator [Methanobacteriota archaeon]|nr:MAG: winged helix-turn-helix transcriptional regulator [Euryarchaeota archaeon]
MQETGLIRRDVKPTRPPRVSYSLTDHGLTVAKLGEPVFLYLRLSSALGVKPDPSP